MSCISAVLRICNAIVASITFLRQLSDAIGLYTATLVYLGLPGFLRMMVVDFFHNIGYVLVETHRLRSLARAVASFPGALLMARLVIPSEPGALPTLSLPTNSEMWLVVKVGVHLVALGSVATSDKLHGMFGSPAASQSKLAGSSDLLISIPPLRLMVGRVLGADGPLV